MVDRIMMKCFKYLNQVPLVLIQKTVESHAFFLRRSSEIKDEKLTVYCARCSGAGCLCPYHLNALDLV